MPEEKNYKQMRDEFQLKYQNELVPKLTEFEKERIKTCMITIAVSGVLFICGIILLLYLYTSVFEGIISAEKPEFLYKFDAAFFILAVGYYILVKKAFENDLKRSIMPDVCACFGNLKWYPSYAYISDVHLFVVANLIPSGDLNEKRDDGFIGSYKDVKINIEECCFTKGSGKSEHTVFDGVIIQFDMNKQFNGNTIIKADSLFHFSPTKNLRHTVLEDVEFEKKYDVFTDDEVEARYLITPSFMERLNNIKLAFKADKISASFYKDKFFIALHTNKDLFSIGSLIKPAYDPKQIFQMFEEMMSIYKLIDHFKLNQKIGL